MQTCIGVGSWIQRILCEELCKLQTENAHADGPCPLTPLCFAEVWILRIIICRFPCPKAELWPWGNSSQNAALRPPPAAFRVCKSKSNSLPISYQIRFTKAGLSDPCFNSLFRNLSYSALGTIECSALARHHSHAESIELGSSHIFLWSVMKWASKGGNESALWHPSQCEFKLRNSRGRSRLRRAFQTCLTQLCCHYFSIFKFLNFHLGISPVLDSNYLFKGPQIILVIVSKNDGVFKNL